MAAETTVSVTLPADLRLQAQKHAQLQHRERGDVLADTLSFYMKVDADWDSLLRRTRALGASAQFPVSMNGQASQILLSVDY